MAGPQGRQNVLDNYVTVAERIAAFHQTYPSGRITTQILEHNEESGFILMRAEIYRSSDDAQPSATGHAFEVRGDSYVNKTSYVENAETSSVGRALAMLGFEVRRGIASREEMEKAARMQTAEKPPAAQRPQAEKPPAAPRAQAEKPPAEPPQAEKLAAKPPSKADEETPADINAEILQAAAALGYDAAKVRKWVNQRFEVTGGLDSLTNHDKREILDVFRERAQGQQTKAAQR
jgi:hypothetical protein